MPVVTSVILTTPVVTIEFVRLQTIGANRSWFHAIRCPTVAYATHAFIIPSGS